MVFVSWILPSLVALLAAWVLSRQRQNPGHLMHDIDTAHQTLVVGTSSNRGEEKGVGVEKTKYISAHPPHNYATYVIGDLHGDVECAKFWVNRTGLLVEALVDDDKDTMWQWTDPTSHLVFMGDYVDKGPTSRQTVEYVKQLTEHFPDHVTALLGNHELELLLDRDVRRWEAWSGAGFHGLAYASAHPQEYLNYIQVVGQDEDKRRPDALDDLVIHALYNASLEVYSYGLHQEIFMASPDRVGYDRSIVRFIQTSPIKDKERDADDEAFTARLQQLVSERLTEYQNAYLNTYRSGTPLGDWLEQRPILVQRNETIFVHGGLSAYAAQFILQLSGGMDGINQLFASHAKEEQLYEFIEETLEGQIIYSEIVTYRGNHPRKSHDVCPDWSQQLLPYKNGAALRLVVGHTPGPNVRVLCNGSLLAVDASLSRWFRNSGNEYCPGDGGTTRNVDKSRTSSNGRYTCPAMNPTCEGQIVRLTQGGQVTILE
jgi:hypothetical protein